ncbi:MAG: lamin tail domain-containing protein [Sandaracinaceae bacterium]|nr:lamin tail domain-containing protein [Sandaracinaceae bacterium]
MRFLLMSLVVLPGCLTQPPPFVRVDGGSDAGAVFAIVDVNVRTQTGQGRTFANVPRRAAFRVSFSAPALNAEAAVFLMRGEGDELLLQDLGESPLRAESAERVVPCQLSVDGSAVELRPRQPLVPGVALVLVVAKWLRSVDGVPLNGGVVSYPVRVSTSPEDGAVLTDTWPASGSSNVPLRLPFAALRFDGQVTNIEHGIALRTESGADLAAFSHVSSCEQLGYRGGFCVVLAISDALPTNTRLSLAINESLLDGTGAAFDAEETLFTTATAEVDAPLTFTIPSCALDEQASELGCLLTDDTQVVLRARASAPVRAWLSLGSFEDHQISPRGELELRLLPLPPGAGLVAQLRTVDLGGNVAMFDVPFATTEALAALAITEVRADPLGPEPQQEYVELYNYGEAALDIAGFSLSDRPDAEGDVFEASFRIAARTRALVVTDDFDPTAPDDVAVPAGVPLIRIGTSLGSGGITNRGEPLYLRDASMHRLSAAPALAVAHPGACIVRHTTSMRDGSLASFEEGPCSPGAMN